MRQDREHTTGPACLQSLHSLFRQYRPRQFLVCQSSICQYLVREAFVRQYFFCPYLYRPYLYRPYLFCQSLVRQSALQLNMPGFANRLGSLTTSRGENEVPLRSRLRGLLSVRREQTAPPTPPITALDPPGLEAAPLFPVFHGEVDAAHTPFRDVDAWLGEHFEHPQLLRHALLESNAAIVGSRVLDYLAPGFCSGTPTSDWDFSVGHDPSSVWRLMTRLEQCGVVWTSKIRRILTLLAHSLEMSGNAVTFYASTHEITEALRQATFEGSGLTGELEAILGRMGKENRHERASIRVHIRPDGRRDIQLTHAARPPLDPAAEKEDYEWSGITVVNGTLCRNKMVHRVQLIATPSGYWNHVLGFHSSCVQGFINGEARNPTPWKRQAD